MSSKYYVYELIDPHNNQVFYVGYTSRDPSKRIAEHLREADQKLPINVTKNEYIKTLLTGGANPIMNVVFESDSAEEALAVEEETIDTYKRISDNGTLTNIAKKGCHHTMSEEGKQRLSAMRTGKSYEEIYGHETAQKAKAKISTKTSGESNPMYGKTHTKKSKQMMSENRKGLTAGKKNGMYGVDRSGEKNTFYGKRHTEESKRKMSEANKGHSHNKGILKTEEHKKALSESRKKKFRSRANIFTWNHNEHGLFVGTAYELKDTYPEQDIRVGEANKVTSDKYSVTSHRGWSLFNTYSI